ncbi:MAG: carboxypeptidase-like regulatory domain-containing protein [Candidatus Angelobacter sp.]
MHIFPGIFRSRSKPEEVRPGNIRIASPCQAEWEKMVGDERVRHCSECNLNVYNLSAMTERQVQELIAGSQGKRLCTRFYRRADGTVLTQDCPWSLRALTRKVSRLGAAVLTAIMSVTVAMARNKPRPATCECNQSQQKDSGIKLTVVDQHGAVIPKAEITLEKKLGKETIAGTTGPAGEWNQLKLAAGRYQVTVKSPGFTTFRSVVDVRDGTLLGLKVKLPVAAANTTVEVKAEPAVIMGTAVGILTEVQSPLVLPSGTAGGQRFPMRP